MDRYRNLIVFIDGTDQDRDRTECAEWSNVARMKIACINEASSDARQMLRYNDGVGTRQHESFLGSSLGVGLEERIQEGYVFLQQEIPNARAEGCVPRIYLFGFSRGAFAARWLASLIHYSGIPGDGVSERIGMENFFHGNDTLAKKLRGDKKYYDVSIEMVGVWDTVKTTLTDDFGVARLPDNVSVAYHAMAIEETRSLFPVFRFEPDPRVTEVWFTGVHADVGGGYDKQGLADISLAWMLNRAAEHGLLLKPDAQIDENIGAYPGHKLELHNSYEGLWKRLHLWSLGMASRSIPRVIAQNDYVHHTVRLMPSVIAGYSPVIPQTAVAWQIKDEARTSLT